MEFSWVGAEGPADSGLLDQPRPELRLESETAQLESRLESETARLESRLESVAAGLQSRPELRLESRLGALILLALVERAKSMATLAAGFGHSTVSGELQKQVRRLKGAGLVVNSGRNLIHPTFQN